MSLDTDFDSLMFVDIIHLNTMLINGCYNFDWGTQYTCAGYSTTNVLMLGPKKSVNNIVS